MVGSWRLLTKDRSGAAGEAVSEQPVGSLVRLNGTLSVLGCLLDLDWLLLAVDVIIQGTVLSIEDLG